MIKIIILITILSQFLFSCSIKKEKEISINIDCPKYFLISEATTILYDNNSILTLVNDINLDCYQKISSPDDVFIDIIMNYKISDIPEYDLFDESFNALVFITNREETLKLSSYEKKINFTNQKNWKSTVNTPYLNKMEIQHFASMKIKYEIYKKGLRIFTAIN